MASGERSSGSRDIAAESRMASLTGYGSFDPFQALGDVGHVGRRGIAGSAFQDGADAGGVADVPGPGLEAVSRDRIGGRTPAQGGTVQTFEPATGGVLAEVGLANKSDVAQA